jgi:hypothetical protein
MMRLFAPYAVYIETFSGKPRTHGGREAIQRSFLESQQNAPPNLRPSLDRVAVAGDRLRSEWTCPSPVFPHPVRGQDL